MQYKCVPLLPLRHIPAGKGPSQQALIQKERVKKLHVALSWRRDALVHYCPPTLACALSLSLFLSPSRRFFSLFLSLSLSLSFSFSSRFSLEFLSYSHVSFPSFFSLCFFSSCSIFSNFHPTLSRDLLATVSPSRAPYTETTCDATPFLFPFLSSFLSSRSRSPSPSIFLFLSFSFYVYAYLSLSLYLGPLLFLSFPCSSSVCLCGALLAILPLSRSFSLSLYRYPSLPLRYSLFGQPRH